MISELMYFTLSNGGDSAQKKGVKLPLKQDQCNDTDDSVLF